METKVFSIFNIKKKNDNKTNDVGKLNVSTEYISTSINSINNLKTNIILPLPLPQTPIVDSDLINCSHNITLDLGDLITGPMRPILKVCN